MNLNKVQKLISLLFIFALIAMLIFLTPFIKYSFGNKYTFYGNFFIENNLIAYPKLLIQMIVLTVIYILTIIIFKSK